MSDEAIDRMAAVVRLTRMEGETDEQLAMRTRMAMRVDIDDDEHAFMRLTPREEQIRVIMTSTPQSDIPNPLYEEWMRLTQHDTDAGRLNPRPNPKKKKKQRRKNKAKEIPQFQELNRFGQIRKRAQGK